MYTVMLLLWTFVASLLLVSGSHLRRQIHQATRVDNFTNAGSQRPAPNRVGGFEEFYRWRQMTFTSLQQGNNFDLFINIFFFRRHVNT